MKNNLVITLIFSSLILFFSCSEAVNDKENSNKIKPSEGKDSDPESVASGGNVLKINNQLFSIPSPVQTTILIREQKIPFDEKMVTDLSKIDSYVTSQKQALNLGVIGSDLAYLSNYEQVKRSLNFLSALESMAEKLDIKANIDPTLIKRFNENINNVDSLNSLNSEFYRNAERYLKDNLQNEASALVLVGGWVESMYFATRNSKNPFLKSRIAEQKAIVKNLSKLLSDFEGPITSKLEEELTKLNKTFSGLSLVYEYKTPITDKDSKTTYIKSKSEVKLTEDQLTEIKQSISKLRDIIIS